MTPYTSTPSLTTVRTMQYLSHKHHADSITDTLAHVHDERTRCDLELERMAWNARAGALWRRMTSDELAEASEMYASQYCHDCGREFTHHNERTPIARHAYLCGACISYAMAAD